MASRSFPVTFAGMLAPFLVWAAHFGVVYGINGLVCARTPEGASLFRLPLSMALVGIATLLALGWVAILLGKAVQGAGPAGHVAAADPRRFARWFVIAGSASALVAILWVAMPALLVPACG
ncbi:hypothetical protein JHL17_21585 [Azospirillum sp. YIM B02556]|uniref:Uncharacterized protein n=1 Tax=Azospirillum endophyticum TaxID=2800326 RepID=A0ABS1F9F9_9PROT|nr:hypothetical protein [Azospirillum endophyticum]MBK1840003.1 hypothetical protein [Azospirillum endophyticum]